MLDTMMQARFAPQNEQSIAAGMRNKMLWLFVFSILFIAIYLPLAPYFYRFFFPQYAVSTLYSQIYALSMLGLMLSPAGSYLSAHKKISAQYASAIAASVFQMGAMLAGVLIAGILGLVIARVITRIAVPTLNFYLYRRSTDAVGA